MIRQIAGVDAVVASRQKPQALRGLVEQLGLRQDAAADRDHRVGGQDVGAFELVIDAHHRERSLGLCARQPVGAGARQLATLRRLVEIGRTQRIGLDAGLVDQMHPAGRAGGEHEFGPADHVVARERAIVVCRQACLTERGAKAAAGRARYHLNR